MLKKFLQAKRQEKKEFTHHKGKLLEITGKFSGMKTIWKAVDFRRDPDKKDIPKPFVTPPHYKDKTD
jgi:hypothetical protein